MEEIPVQLRLGFDHPVRGQRLEMTLTGLSVVAKPSDGDVDTAAAYLSSVGAAVRVDERGALFPVRQLPLLRDMPRQVDLVAVGPLRTLLLLVQEPPEDGLPVVVSADSRQSLNLSWYHGGRELNEPLDMACAPALKSMEVPLVAENATWDALLREGVAPTVLGRARANLDGFVELRATAPDRLEMAPLPALFRIDDTRFGMPERYADRITQVPGLVWDGPLPSYDGPPAEVRDLPVTLSQHAAADLHGLVDSLGRHRSQAVVWDRGLGRRTFCAAAVETLEAYPLLVVARPAAVWAWQRQFDLLGRSLSLLDPDADVHLVTYRDLPSRMQLAAPAAIVLDELDAVVTDRSAPLEALHRLDGLTGGFRIACSSSLPASPADLVEFMSILRPMEFRSGIPVVVRYPGDSLQRLREHVSCYVSERREGRAGATFRRSRVVALECPEPLARAAQEVLSQELDAEDAVAALRSIVARGTSTAISPKVSKALEVTRAAVASGRTAAVLCRDSALATMLRSMLLPAAVEVVPAGQQPTGPLVVCCGEPWPDVRGYEVVIVAEYPASHAELERSVGGSADTEGPAEVTVLHLTGTIDDRLAVAAAIRRENPTAVQDPRYLLAGQ